MVDSKTFEIAIIGGGPVGMFALFYTGLRKVDSLLIEALPELGGQTAVLYPEKNILDVAGFSNISGQQLIENLNNQLQQFDNVTIKNNSKIIEVVKVGNIFELKTENQTIRAKSIILATGKGDFKPRKLQVTGAENFSQISYQPKKLDDYKNKTVAIAGGGDSALDLALQISDLADKTYLIHRSDHFTALETTIEKVDNSKIEQLINTKISAFDQINNKLIIKTDKNNLEVDDLIVSYGMVSDNQTIKNWDLDFEFDHQGLKTNSNQQTSVPGVFAIGDISYYDGKAELIATGFGEALTAVNSAIKYYQPEAAGPAHSTAQRINNGKLE